MKITKRQLAARFVDALDAGTMPLAQLSQALAETAVEAGYGRDDLTDLVSAVETQLQIRYAAAEVQLTTAHRLPAPTVRNLVARIAAAAGLKHHSYVHKVDAALLGGFEARVGDLTFTNNIRTNLEALEVRHG